MDFFYKNSLINWSWKREQRSNPQQLETHGGVLTNVATQALRPMHQTIRIHSADELFIVLDGLHT